MFTKAKHLLTRVRSGFTLIEMLVVIAIIGILISLVSSALISVRQKAYNVACLSSLKQTATSIISFATDHQGHLPPNLHPYQSPYFNLDRRYLMHPSKLGPYLNAPIPEKGLWSTDLDKMKYAVKFQCPARALQPGDKRQMYLLNTQMKNSDGSITPIWGTGSASRDSLNDSGGGHINSLRMEQVSNPSSTWLMADLDQEFPVGGIAPHSPKTPVHGNHRNAIYFDMHVGTFHLPESAP